MAVREQSPVQPSREGSLPLLHPEVCVEGCEPRPRRSWGGSLGLGLFGVVRGRRERQSPAATAEKSLPALGGARGGGLLPTPSDALAENDAAHRPALSLDLKVDDFSGGALLIWAPPQPYLDSSTGGHAVGAVVVIILVVVPRRRMADPARDLRQRETSLRRHLVEL